MKSSDEAKRGSTNQGGPERGGRIAPGGDAPLGAVLVGVDFSRGSDLAVARAALLPLAEGAQLILLHVAPADAPRHLLGEARRRLEERAAELTARCRDRGLASVSVRAELANGDAFAEIVRASRRLSADLTVLGRHGLNRLKDLLIGTTAERVLRKGDCPVLVVTSGASRPYRRPMIAAAIDDTATACLALAVRVAGAAVASIPVIHAYQAPFDHWLGRGGSEAAGEFRRHYRAEALDRLRSWMDGIDVPGVELEPVVVKGDPRAVILLEVTERRADLLVLGTHVRSVTRRVLLGSVAAWMAQAASCDVLVARTAQGEIELP
jgi:nucleotide-binding universal stress UspA family protein